MATLKATGTKTIRSIRMRKDFFSPDVYVTLEIGDELVSVNRAEILAAIGAVEPTTEPTPPTVTRRDKDVLLVNGVSYVAKVGVDFQYYNDEANYNERAGAENRAVAEFLRAEQAPVAAEIAALEFAYTTAFPFGLVSKDTIGKLHAAGFRILP